MHSRGKKECMWLWAIAIACLTSGEVLLVALECIHPVANSINMMYDIVKLGAGCMSSEG